MVKFVVASFVLANTDFEDLPFLMREKFANNASAIDLTSFMPGHVDIPRLRKGRVGGFFWYRAKRLLC